MTYSILALLFSLICFGNMRKKTRIVLIFQIADISRNILRSNAYISVCYIFRYVQDIPSSMPKEYMLTLNLDIFNTNIFAWLLLQSAETLSSFGNLFKDEMNCILKYLIILVIINAFTHMWLGEYYFYC